MLPKTISSLLLASSLAPSFSSTSRSHVSSWPLIKRVTKHQMEVTVPQQSSIFLWAMACRFWSLYGSCSELVEDSSTQRK